MARYANQWSIKIDRQKVNFKNEQYFAVSEEEISFALESLSGNAFKLYIYLVGNRNGYILDFSTTHFCRTTNMSPNTARSARQELMDIGVLEMTGEHKYTFHSVPSNFEWDGSLIF